MKPGIIECAFQGALGRDPQARTSERTGRQWVGFSVAVGEGEATQWIEVAAFGPAADAASQLDKGDSVYIEGKLSTRLRWSGTGEPRVILSAAARTVQPLGRIGNRKPKPTRSRQETNKRAAPDVNAPLPFDDALPI